MLVSPLALVIDSLIIPLIAGLSFLPTVMIFVLIMTPIMTIVKPIVTELLEKLFSNKYKSNEIIMKKIGGSVNNK
jgi:antibiotic biosynthesis monooxygenase (ABM) superfamily enzyme